MAVQSALRPSTLIRFGSIMLVVSCSCVGPWQGCSNGSGLDNRGGAAPHLNSSGPMISIIEFLKAWEQQRRARQHNPALP